MRNQFVLVRRTVAAYWHSAGVGLLLALVFFLLYYHFLQNDRSFNSDQLYCIHFCDDLLQGRDVQGFHMPAAPYIFPDITLLTLCNLLTSDLAALFLLYSLLYYSLLLFVLSAIGRQIGLFWSESFRIAGLGAGLSLGLSFQSNLCRSRPAFLSRQSHGLSPHGPCGNRVHSARCGAAIIGSRPLS